MIIEMISSFGMVGLYRYFLAKILGFDIIRNLIDLEVFGYDGLIVCNGIANVL